MDSKRFDAWTRNRALRLSRRDALHLMGAGAAAAALPVPGSHVLAQGTCSLTIHAETAAGPSAPAAYDGTLQFMLGPDGIFTQASFSASTGGTQAVTGRATGRAIDFQVTFAGNQTVSFSGSAEQPLGGCQGAASGFLAGPRPGDIGGWQSTGAGGGGVAIPASSSANSGSGSSPCPTGTVLCGGVCVTNCPAGQSFDTGSCTCFVPQPACLEFQSPCNGDDECCSGFCTDGECRTCGGINCDGKCIDTSVDPENCGGCGIVCNGDCVGGTCEAACLPDGAPCQSTSDCCSPGCNGICGCGRLGQSCNEDAGFYCCDGTPVVCFDGACCILNGFPCSADADCCDYIAGNGSCTNGVCVRPA